MQAQIRQRMAERFREDFAAFRASARRAADGSSGMPRSMALLNARRAPIYRLVDGKPQPVIVRIGASDGSSTEVSGGGLKEGDAIVTGERAKE